MDRNCQDVTWRISIFRLQIKKNKALMALKTLISLAAISLKVINHALSKRKP